MRKHKTQVKIMNKEYAWPSEIALSISRALDKSTRDDGNNDLEPLKQRIDDFMMGNGSLKWYCRVVSSFQGAKVIASSEKG